MDAQAEFEAELEGVLKREIAGCQALTTLERLSGGASQETYRLTLQSTSGELNLAMRRAPGGVKDVGESGYPGLATEALLMRCARAAGVPEPEIYYVLQPADGLGEGFIMQWLDGEALGARIVRAPELAEIRPRLAYECGRILARIHAIDLDASGLRQALTELSPETYVHRTWERYQALGSPQPMIDYAARWLLRHLPSEQPTCLVHNDFRNGNLMVGADGVVAVLDWETAHIGDPMRDIGWICTNSWRFGNSDMPVGGFGDYRDLFRGYREVSGTRVDPERVKFWEVFGSFWWAVGCLGMAEHYRSGPDKSVERPAIGRRSSECQVDCVNLIIPGPVELLTTEPLSDSQAMPTADELLRSVRDFLRQEVMPVTHGRLNFMTRVAGNSLDIVRRELAAGTRLEQWETRRLRRLLGAQGSLPQLKQRLVDELRADTVGLDDPELVAYLREAVVNQVAIDQPKYSGYRLAQSKQGN